MSVEQLFRDIESHEFAAAVCIASTRSVFLDALHNHPKFQGLLRQLINNHLEQISVVKRISQLVNFTVDYRYMNPYDVALASYMWALYRVNSSYTSYATNLALEAKQIWWTREVASIVIKEETSSSVLETVPQEAQAFFDRDTIAAFNSVPCAFRVSDNKALVNFTTNLDNYFIGEMSSSIVREHETQPYALWYLGADMINPSYEVGFAAKHTATTELIGENDNG